MSIFLKVDQVIDVSKDIDQIGENDGTYNVRWLFNFSVWIVEILLISAHF